ncbi:MAG: DinB family protein [Ilumatobacter sp.]
MSDQVIPEDRDWTWVLERPCPECGFDAGSFPVSEMGVAIRRNAASWAAVLGGDRATLATRRRSDRWSDLEYSAHVRDVFRLYLDRLTLMLERNDPLYPNWDQDASAVEERYNDQDPTVVRDELLADAEALASGFDAVCDADWKRTGRRSDGAAFTVTSFARYLIHDPVHHLWDVTGTSGI